MLLPTPSASIQLGDALGFMASYNGPAFDLIFSDPLWGTGQVRKGEAGSYADTLGIDAYTTMMQATVAFGRKHLKPTGWLLIWADYRKLPYWAVEVDNQGLYRTGEIVVESLLGNPGKSRWPCRHSNILVAERTRDRGYFDVSAMPTEPRRAGKKVVRGKVYDGERRVGSVLNGTMNQTDPERNGYPDQKPLFLLQPLIAAHCPPEGLVCDPFCGSGSVVVASATLGRAGIGVDRSEVAVGLARGRLAGLAQSEFPMATDRVRLSK